MRRLTSLCKRLPFIERSCRRENLPFTLSILAMLVVASCRLGHGPAELSDDAVTSQSTTATAPGHDVSFDETASLSLLLGPEHTPAATLAAPDCVDQAGELSLTLPLISSFGDVIVQAKLKPRSGPPSDPSQATLVRATAEGYDMAFHVASKLGEQLRATACASTEGSGADVDANALTPPPDVATQLAQVLEHVAPDCERVELTRAGFACRLPTAEPDAAEQELVGIQTTMIRRWSRQPYLLARRLAVGVTLSHALQSDDALRSLDTFCRLIQNALPAELPATLQSRRWQAAACRQDSSRRIDAALFGLAKTIAEVDAMRQLFESTSRLGHLAVRIPQSTLAGDRVLVSLLPEPDVTENLAKETQKLWASAASDAAPESAPLACWHPLYAESPELLRLARQLALAGDGDELQCGASTPGAADHQFSPARYFAESITSETEFVVTNGHAKTLRLPTGHYRYTLRILPEDPDAWDDASQLTPQAGGTIVWDTKRPRAVIEKW